VNAEILPIQQTRQGCIGDSPDAHLQRGAIGNQLRNVFADGAFNVSDV
jgi:hypothetical protein